MGTNVSIYAVNGLSFQSVTPYIGLWYHGTQKIRCLQRPLWGLGPQGGECIFTRRKNLFPRQNQHMGHVLYHGKCFDLMRLLMRRFCFVATAHAAKTLFNMIGARADGGAYRDAAV